MGLAEMEKMQQLEREIEAAHKTDYRLERDLSEELLDIAKMEQDQYYKAYARLHLLYYAMSMRDTQVYIRHMTKAERCCRENEYHLLLLQICNLNGLYYDLMDDEHSALQSFLEGIGLAKKLGNMLILAKLYNNMAEMFRAHEDYAEATRYYLEAYGTISRHPNIVNENMYGFFIANLADSCRLMGDLRMAANYLDQISPTMDEDCREMQLVRASRAALLAATGDTQGAISLIDKVLCSRLEECDDLMLAYEVLSHIMYTALSLKNEQYADRILVAMRVVCKGDESARKLELHNFWITSCITFDRKQELCEAYRTYYHLSTGYEKHKNLVKCEALRASIVLRESARRTDEYKKRAHYLESMVYTDDLTKLYNRRYFNKLVTKAATDIQTTRIGFIMVDVDCFKQYNDLYGHTAGDRLLQAAGESLMHFSSERVQPCRYGGDEFACLCINCTDDDIARYIDNVRECFAQMDIVHERSQCGNIATLSIGYSNCCLGQIENVYTILGQADEALYASKLRGRNTSTRYQAPKGVAVHSL